MSRVRRQSHPPSLLSLPRSLTTMDGTTGRLPDGVSCGPRPPPSGADYFSVPRALITRRLDPPERVLILSSKHSFVTRPPVNRGHTLNTILARIGYPFRARNRARRRHSSVLSASYYVFLRFNRPDLFIRQVHHPLPASWPSSSSNYKYFSLITVERGDRGNRTGIVLRIDFSTFWKIFLLLYFISYYILFIRNQLDIK